MIRMGGVGASSSAGKNESQQNRSSSSWESFVLPDAIESVVEDVMENFVDNSCGGYLQQVNGYGVWVVGPMAGLGYYEDLESQQQQQQQASGGYEPGEGVVDEHEHTSSHVDERHTA
jgi:hypothetical protein